MTEIHAFDPDGTASPGAQIALSAATGGLATRAEVEGVVDGHVSEAVAGLASEAYVGAAIGAIPDATTEQRGMMTAASVADLSRLTTEPLSRRALQPALRGQRAKGVGIVFAGSSTIQGHQATSDDRRPAQRISSYLTSRPAQTAVSGSAPTSGVQVWA